ncbi:carbohydrate ABC transporter permease [Actinopolymorpha pittospori]|uniref:Multiple sugar transport system permease protein n=1 Tax=Actinopolymorpha pittospori TaxID=648752 RepID=A0A927RFF8_9ACTN|nr:sugar ABC transporter permease [Actinopolymorpha pittospori]MBE1603166.1 multiple sugar transport system permease protein [Actinopolymorpha pittospori]
MVTPSLPAAHSRHARSGSRRSGGSRRWTGWGFLAPFLVVFAFTLIAPVVYAIYLSFFQDRLVGGNVFAGFANYTAALHDPKFWSALRRVVLFFFVQVPIMLALSTFAALALDSARLRFPAFFRISLFLPYAVPSVVAALMWGFIYGTDFGLVGNINSAFGISLPDPLSNTWVLAAMGNIAAWGFIGYNMLILYAALRTVPKELYEAAEIDRAGTFAVIRAIKLPAMRSAFVVALIFSVIGSFQLFNEPNVLRTLAPNSISTNFTPNMYAYNLAFSGQQFNYAAAIAIIMGIITMVVAYVVQTVGIRKDGR